MTRTVYLRWATGQTIYAKPSPLDDDPSWADDAIAFTEVDSTGQYSADIGDVHHEAFLQAGGSEASSDKAIWSFSETGNVPTLNQIREALASELADLDVSISTDELAASLALKIVAMRASDTSSSVDHTVVRGTTWRIPIGTLPAGWTRVEVTARSAKSNVQSESLLHVVLSSPADDFDGLQIWNGKAADEKTDAAITEVAGDHVCVVNASRTANVGRGELCWDAKVWKGDEEIDQPAHGTLLVERDVTRLASV